MARPPLGIAWDQPDSYSVSEGEGPEAGNQGGLALGVAAESPRALPCQTSETLVRDIEGIDPAPPPRRCRRRSCGSASARRWGLPLGRGPGSRARGRVFLAVEPALADRPVVLKVTPRDGGEHLALARLQHPHIVPLYSVQDLPDRDLRVLCMPYLGGATLSQLLEPLAETAPRRRTGRDLLGELDRAQAALPLPAPSQSPARRFLAGASYSRAICWIGACLADALHDAHGRGLVHLDVKPSNVLVVADGTPMLLDFHLARGPIRPDGPRPVRVGGSSPYMPPEQRAAMAAAHEGREVRVVVDGRADIYALGVLLLAALGRAALAVPPAADGPADPPRDRGGGRAFRRPRPLPGRRPSRPIPGRRDARRGPPPPPGRPAAERGHEPEPRRTLAEGAPSPARGTRPRGRDGGGPRRLDRRGAGRRRRREAEPRRRRDRTGRGPRASPRPRLRTCGPQPGTRPGPGRPARPPGVPRCPASAT